ncbi:hypothetical protein K525DRAFT_191680 [Schizophyllum commune Loenen D]|nr:hypothetical protein K525DRAFT_191680 [Schizophyllum commune Loenen D]
MVPIDGPSPSDGAQLTTASAQRPPLIDRSHWCPRPLSPRLSSRQTFYHRIHQKVGAATSCKSATGTARHSEHVQVHLYSCSPSSRRVSTRHDPPLSQLLLTSPREFVGFVLRTHSAR